MTIIQVKLQPLSHDEKLRIHRKNLILLLYKDISKGETLKIEHNNTTMNNSVK